MTNVGILIDNTNLNQPAFLAINRINASFKDIGGHKYSLFYKEPGPFCTKLVATATSLDKIWGFNGDVISTNLDLTMFLLRANGPKIKILYMFELEWIKGYGNFLSNSSIYNNKDLIIIAPSASYADALYNYCGRKANAIIPQFNIQEIMKAVENEICPREPNRPN